MERRTRWITCGVALALGAIALRQDLQVTRDCVHSEKVSGIVRLALVTDLHSTWYGAGQAGLLDAIAREKPDAVLLAGDIVDDQRPLAAAKAFLQAAAAAYPVYYVLGNHEFRIKEPAAVKAWARSLGVTVLEGTEQVLSAAGQDILVCGVDDPAGYGGVQSDAWRQQFDAVCALAQASQAYTVLLSHRPEWADLYTAAPFDLVVSGHAHGGQVRIPYLLPGLIAPGQGLFPQYAGGVYALGRSALVVSRGLCRNGIPRVFNRPELVIIDVTPKSAYTET